MARLDQVYHLMPEAEATFAFSQAVRTKNFLFLSGTVSVDTQFRSQAIGDMAGQIRTAYGNIKKTLADHGLTFEHVVKETIYTADMDALVSAVPARKAFYQGVGAPAATWVKVAGLVSPEWLLEIEVLAELP